ncbi:MAG: hypothetical protein HYV34_04890 [Candidatus Kerfeldbacteria bacterium]|nr:hypothetical protein [Candidatus Kerfeldbacteria bacterium]
MPKAQWDTPKTEDLFRAILAVKTLPEAKRFFRDLLTEEEILEFSKRWQAAQMLDQRIPYSKIVKTTGLSSTTVARVSRWLTRGMNGYTLMLKRLNKGHHAPLSFEKRTSSGVH